MITHISFSGKATESGQFLFWPFGGTYTDDKAIRVEVEDGDTAEDVQRKLEEALAARRSM